MSAGWTSMAKYRHAAFKRVAQLALWNEGLSLIVFTTFVCK